MSIKALEKLRDCAEKEADLRLQAFKSALSA